MLDIDIVKQIKKLVGSDFYYKIEKKRRFYVKKNQIYISMDL